MVFVGCTKCGSFCHHLCYFEHNADFACHNGNCPGHDESRIHDRVDYNDYGKPYICFSEDGCTEWIVTPIMCMDPFIVYKEEIQEDGSLRITIWSPGPYPGHGGFTAEHLIPRTRRPRPSGYVERREDHLLS